jgi:hypothetical protein
VTRVHPGHQHQDPDQNLARSLTAAQCWVITRPDQDARFCGRSQDLAEHAISDLHGVHLDIPGPDRRVEAMIASAGTKGIQFANIYIA